jgi:uncharacterized protein (DUF488 family)
VDIYTIGFTRRSAEQFFEPLRAAGIRRLLDIRLNNTSQLAGFTKGGDLPYFLREICGIEYEHEPALSPTEEILDGYRQDGDWERYEQEFLALMASRRVESVLDRKVFQTPTVLLCSEPTSERCHRRLVVEYLRHAWGDVTQRDL